MKFWLMQCSMKKEIVCCLADMLEDIEHAYFKLVQAISSMATPVQYKIQISCFTRQHKQCPHIRPGPVIIVDIVLDLVDHTI